MTAAYLRPQEIVERALAISRADDCAVIVTDRTEANLRWANNSLTTNGAMRSRQVIVVSFVGGAVGSVSRHVSNVDDLALLVSASELAARGASPAEDAMPLVEPGAPAGPWEDGPAETSIEVFSEVAPALGQAFGESGGADRLLFGFAEHTMETTYLGTSSGLRLRYDQPAGRVELNGKTGDRSRSVWTGVGTRDFSDVDVAALVSEVSGKLAWGSRQVDLPPGRYETLLPPSCVADLMVYLYWVSERRQADEGRTVFSKAGGGTRIGEQLASIPVTLRSDPNEPGLETGPFLAVGTSGQGTSVFDNGMPLGRTDWIRDGVLQTLVTPRWWAGKSDTAPSAYVENLVLEDPRGGRDLADLIAATERGLLLTTLWYIREVDPQNLLLTGLTRDGVFLIENGEVTGAVNNFRFNESPVDLLSRMTEVGSSSRTLPREWGDYFTRAAMPTLRIPDFNMSSVSPAS
ncbi:MAG: TldD/PmbA family protein [Geodermatophilaceae bacterium]|nr:TldD/PmbA family protein [Geodermatophilaceae bacterium]MDQ3456346.1 TldD/PmbA family protein [Actinomycetota bacterium]